MTMIANENGNDHRWCILRTSGGGTLPLAKWLTKAGMEAWTPKKTFKRARTGNCVRIDGTRPTIEIDAPILPTFVFARAINIDRLIALTVDPVSQHPPFSILRRPAFEVARGAYHYPFVGDGTIAGMQEAERDAAAALVAAREAETREEAERIRLEALRTEKARMKALRIAAAERRKALRAERRTFDDGEFVTVDEVAAFGGMTGKVKRSNRRFAFIDFGGPNLVQIETWQLIRSPVQAAQS